jgi:hypothetical protein
MTGHEQSGGVSKVEARTARFAEQWGKYAADKAERALREHVDAGRLSPDQLAAIRQAEHDKEVAKWKADREAGKHNDPKSLSPGLTAIVTDFGKKVTKEIMHRRGIPMDLNAPQFTVLFQHASDIELLYQMSLPSGMYTTLRENFMSGQGQEPEIDDPNHVIFYTLAAGTDLLIRSDTDNSIPVPRHGVIRVEGSEGELWQNPNYSPEGQLSGRGPTPVDL